jgi:hypothetical protein
MTDPGETCDDGVNNGTYNGSCNTTCNGYVSCGDGIQEGDEFCDDGVNNGTTGYCNLTCSDFVLDPEATWCNDNIIMTDVPYNECAVLEKLYNNTNGSGWNNSTNWLSSTTVCNNWYGITCNNNQVSQISFSR